MKTLLIGKNLGQLIKIRASFKDFVHVEKRDLVLKAVMSNAFEIVVLDLLYSKEISLELIRNIRKYNRCIPIITLTEDNSIDDIVSCLETGADNCIPRPFDSKVLFAKMESILRRVKKERGNDLLYGPIRIDPVSHKVWRDNKEIRLTGHQYRLLLLFVLSPGEVLSRSTISRYVWGEKQYTNIIDVYVNYLRNKMDRGYSEKLIHTVKGAGYLLRVE